MSNAPIRPRNGVVLFAALVALAACQGTDLERGALGAAGGAAAAQLTGSDVVGGALIGGAAGVFCDDAGICRNTR
ncbi:MAG: hypothetical protein AAGG09_21175 [Pseudomonadota bacterium]